METKLQWGEFIEYVTKYDIIGFVETWAKSKNDFENALPGYTCFSKARRKRSRKGRYSGGITVFIRNDILNGVETVCDVKLNDSVFIKLSGRYFGMGKDLILGVIYIPPEQSVYHKIYDNYGYEALDDTLKSLKEIYGDLDFILMGDFNARTSQESDFIIDDCVSFLPTLEGSSYPYDSFHQLRSSVDGTWNKFGEHLLNICKLHNIHILNGRIYPDVKGNFTYISEQGCSLIDYGIVSTDLFEYVLYFEVIIRPESKHLPIVCSLKCNTNITNNYEPESVVAYNSLKYKWNPHLTESFISNIEAIKYKYDNVNLENDIIYDSEVLAINIKQMLYEAGSDMKAEGNLLKKRVPNNIVQPKWFDDECILAKHKKWKQLRKYRSDRSGFNLEMYLNVKKTFKTLCYYKKKSLQNKFVIQLEKIINQPKDFWRFIKNKGKRSVNTKIDTPPMYKLHAYFKSLLSESADQTYFNSDFFRCDLSNYEPLKDENYYILNGDISMDEIKTCVKHLKNNKAPGIDGIPGESFKYTFNSIQDMLLILFNKLFTEGYFPHEWSKGIIIPIYKKGNKLEAANYRGITLLSTFSKLYVYILNNRLKQWMEYNNNVHEEQAGFRAGYSTLDNIFILHSVVQKVLSIKRRACYCLFVDFSKAFDTINRSSLFTRLKCLGVHGKLLNSIISLYKNTEACVKNGFNVSEYFNCNIGVRQGCTLSPNLFTLYINCLADMVKKNGEGIQLQPDISTLSILLYADDIVLISDTIRGLQKHIDTLERFCNLSGMSVNLDKTKVMVFKNGGHLSKYEKWHYKGNAIESVSYYKYLGLTFSCRNIWSKTIEVISLQGRKTCSLIQDSLRNFGTVSYDVYDKLFNTIAVPALCYGAEIWGYREYKLIENVQINYLKYYLGVSRNAPGIAVLGECGRNKLYIYTIIRCIKYWLRILKQSNDRYTRKCYTMLYDLDQRGKENWVTNIKYVLNTYGFGYVWYYQSVGDEVQFLCMFNQRVADIGLQTRESDLRSISKLNTYCSFKNNFTIECYVKNIRDFKIRASLANFRCSGHKLEVERGRWENVDRSLRHCKCCKNDEVEDEYHFVARCSCFNEIRQKFIPIIVNNTNYDTFILLLQATEYVHDIANFIFHATRKRNDILKDCIYY